MARHMRVGMGVSTSYIVQRADATVCRHATVKADCGGSGSREERPCIMLDSLVFPAEAWMPCGTTAQLQRADRVGGVVWVQA